MARPSSTEKQSGFSTKTCRPARAAPIAAGQDEDRVEIGVEELVPVGHDPGDRVAIGRRRRRRIRQVADRCHVEEIWKLSEMMEMHRLRDQARTDHAGSEANASGRTINAGRLGERHLRDLRPRR
jgi:hypothetical protein